MTKEIAIEKETTTITTTTTLSNTIVSAETPSFVFKASEVETA